MTSLAYLYPEVAAQWHPTKNGSLKPDEIVPGSHKKAWWKCAKGPDHEWQALPYTRTIRNLGCPFCAGQKLSVTNSLATLFSDVAVEWHPTKNADLTSDQILAGSRKRVWWKCPNGADHEWETSVDHRTGSKKTACPFCEGLAVSVTNSLSSLCPDIAAQWHPTKNGDLTPDGIVAGSAKSVWWKCPEGPDHEWHTPVENRTRLHSGCPCCFGRQASVTNSLKSLLPELARQWHPTRNGKLTPDRVPAGSNKRAWWKCNAGSDHEWQAIVSSRSAQGVGCPCCANKRVSTTNCLASNYPAIAAEWHPTKNGNLSPTGIVAGSNRRVWWKCAKGPDHEWRAMPAARTGNRKAGCPFCAGAKVSVTNSLASLYPEIAAEWHPTKNRDVTPDKITYGSELKCWWLCRVDENHEWRATPNGRTYMQSGCPFCTIVPRSRREIILATELSQFLDVDLDKHKVSAGGKILDVDILIPSHGLIIEYDGSYWHKDKSDADTEKSRLLKGAGWKVIRVREKPLQETGPNDVMVKPTDGKAMVDAVLRKIECVCGIKLQGLSRYLTRQTLAKADLAEAYIAKLLTSARERDATTLRQRL